MSILFKHWVLQDLSPALHALILTNPAMGRTLSWRSCQCLRSVLSQCPHHQNGQREDTARITTTTRIMSPRSRYVHFYKSCILKVLSLDYVFVHTVFQCRNLSHGILGRSPAYQLGRPIRFPLSREFPPPSHHQGDSLAHLQMSWSLMNHLQSTRPTTTPPGW